jgi:TPR repeat protein
MRMKRWAWLSIGIVAALAGWLLLQSRSPDRDRHAGPLGESDASAGVTAGREPALSAPQPLPEGSFAAVRGTWESRARAGDAEAAYRLGSVLGACRTYQPMPYSAFASLIARMAALGDGVRIGGRTIDDDLSLDAMLERKQELDELCEGVDGLAASSDIDEAQAWLARAAEQGHVLAMSRYTDYAFAAFPTDAELLANATEVARRRERARLWMQRAVEAGEIESLFAMAMAYGPNGILGDDPVRALAYLQSYRESGGIRDDAARLGEALLREYAGPEQLAQAAALSPRITHAFRNGRPAP